MMPEIHPDAIHNLVTGDHGDPFSLLGPHAIGDSAVSIRVFRPSAHSITLLEPSAGAAGPRRHAMTRLDESGLFELTLDQPRASLRYSLEAEEYSGQVVPFEDPYRFTDPWFSEMDLYLWAEGRFRHSYEKFGAHLRTVDGVAGVQFAVWAPNAYRVSVIGPFNAWDARVHAMNRQGLSGVWEIFIPGLETWAQYKFDLRSQVDGHRSEKADPYGYAAEMRPRTASLVVDLDSYTWSDNDWIAARAEGSLLNQPVIIYEAHLGSWKRKFNPETGTWEWLTYRELAHTLVPYLRDMGYTHVELMPVMEHPLDMSWGYQVTGYFAATSRYGTPHDLMYFIDQCHDNNIGVILDWVPAHFPKDGFALSYFDGTHLYEHADPRQGEHPDWGTYIFNYDRNEVRNFLISNALFWLDKYHVDGLRVDAVSSMLYLDFGRKEGDWIANEHGGNENIPAIQFLQETNHIVHEEHPGVVTIAEESTAWPMVSRPTYLGGLGFTFKWNMGWMHDTLAYVSRDPIHRRWHHHKLTFSIMYAFSENFVLSLSHDEVVHGKGSMIGKIAGDVWQKFATLRLLHGYQITHPGKKLCFMGQEIGQWQEWAETRSLDWHLTENYETHRGLQRWVRDLNHFYREQPALWQQDFTPAGFRWIEANDADQSVFSYIRYAEDRRDFLVVVCNFTPVPRSDYRIGVPEAGYYAELLNSDASNYGGGNVGSQGGRFSDPWGMHGLPYSLSITVPPLGCTIYKLLRD